METLSHEHKLNCDNFRHSYALCNSFSLALGRRTARVLCIVSVFAGCRGYPALLAMSLIVTKYYNVNFVSYSPFPYEVNRHPTRGNHFNLTLSFMMLMLKFRIHLFFKQLNTVVHRKQAFL